MDILNKIKDAMDVPAFVDSLQYMWKGLLGIFVVTLAIILVTAILNSFSKLVSIKKQ